MPDYPTRELIIRETDFPYATRQEVVGELVRCKDCKHTLKGNNGALVCCLTKMVGTTDPNWFCADAERKDNVEQSD